MMKKYIHKLIAAMNVHTCRDSRDNKYIVLEYNMTLVKISSKYKS